MADKKVASLAEGGPILAGKVALISGGARGMGASHARSFVAAGARVVIADILDDEGEALAAELGSENCVYTTLDVTSESAWKDAVKFVVDTFGKIDVLVNNAGVACHSPIEDCELSLFQRVIDINQTGVFLGMREVIRPMVAAGGGSIINISSIDGITGMENVLPYVASKFAVTGMTKTAALELAGRNIRVNSIHPGYIETPMMGGFDTDDSTNVSDGVQLMRDYCNYRVPAKRIGQSQDITNIALFLASDASAYCNGSQFVCDGGMLAGEILPDMG